LFQQEIQQQSDSILLPSFLLDDNYVSKLGAYNHYLTFGGYPAISGSDTQAEEKVDWLKNLGRATQTNV